MPQAGQYHNHAYSPRIFRSRRAATADRVPIAPESRIARWLLPCVLFAAVFYREHPTRALYAYVAVYPRSDIDTLTGRRTCNGHDCASPAAKESEDTVFGTVYSCGKRDFSGF